MRHDHAPELDRRLQNVTGFGTIAEVDHGRQLVRLDIDGRRTGWLQYPAEIGANFRRWRPLRIGTQVVYAAPSGEPANAVITQILYSGELGAPADAGELDVIQFDDGTRVEYDSAASRLTVTGAGDIAIHAKGDLRLQAVGTIHMDAAAIRVFEGG